MLLAALCIVLGCSIAFAATYWQEWFGVYGLFCGEDYLNVTTGAVGHAFQIMEPDVGTGEHLATVTLFKGGQYVTYKPNPPSGLSEPSTWWSCTCPATSGQSGLWEADLWHYVEVDYDYDSRDVYIAEGSKIMSSPSSELTAIHPSVLGRLGLDSNWSYSVNLRPSGAANNISKSDRGALDLLYHTRLRPSELSTGDYFPFLLLHESGRSARAVFPKATGEIRVINLTLSDEGWIVENIDTVK
jgi:hypothetical protein